ncbi:phage tail tape measure protein [Virgibacillus sp. Bac332]|uniref:phage tail tape measure protein n=1 Tax=Virgibacillus sp. Bac332 TaxID=2419842 RepID=UPI0013CE67BA|nr:phage tail tape measure protein [Virgibacillus sp. Bac332]
MADGKITIGTKIDELGAKKGINNLQKTLGTTAKKMQKVGSQMSKYITAPLAAVGAAGFAAADQLDKAYRNIQVGTGAVGKDLEDLKRSFKEVFKTVPNDAETVSNALASLNTFTGATGKTLEDLTRNVLNASRTLGEDGVANSEAFGRAMKQWQIPAEEGTKSLDGLYKLTMDYGVGLGEISSHLTTYGAVLNNAGFSMQESAELMASLESEGIAVSRIMPGLNASFRKWAGEGKNSRTELSKVVEQIRETEDSQKALSLATEVFGAEGAQRLMTAIRNGAIPALDELGGAMEGTSGLVQETSDDTLTLGERFQILKNNAIDGLEPVGEIIMDLAEKYIPPLVEKVQEVAEWFQNLSPAGQKMVFIIGAIVAVIPPLIMLAGSLALAIMGISLPVLAVIAGIGLLIAAGVALWQNWEMISTIGTAVFTSLWEFLKMVFNGIWITIKTITQGIWGTIQAVWNMIKTTTQAVWNAIKVVISTVWNIIKSIVKGAINVVKTVITTVWNTIKTVTNAVWNGIKKVISSVWNGIKSVVSSGINLVKSIVTSVWNTIKSVTSSVWNGIKSTVGGFIDSIWGTVKRIFGKIKNFIGDAWDGVKSGTDDVWDGITGSIKGAINGVIGAINGMINALNGLSIKLPKIPDWVPGLGGKGGGSISFPDIPKIPSLDVGTNFVAKDGLAMIHKGEAVVPKKYNPALGNGGGKKMDLNIALVVDGEELTRIVEPNIDTSMGDKLTLNAYLRGDR